MSHVSLSGYGCKRDMSRYLYMDALEIIFDLPFGLPINNIISPMSRCMDIDVSELCLGLFGQGMGVFRF